MEMTDKKKTEMLMIGCALTGLMTRPTADLAQTIAQNYGTRITIADGIGLLARDFGRATMRAVNGEVKPGQAKKGKVKP